MDYTLLIASEKFEDIQQIFTSQKPIFTVEPSLAISQYKVSEHDIFDTSLRADKTIVKDTGKVNANGEPITTPGTIKVARIGIPFQKLIVNRRVGFMLSTPVTLDVVYIVESDNEKALVDLIERIQNNNKIEYKNKEVARRMMSECECAEIWYFVPNLNPAIEGKFTLKMKIVSPDMGDSLYPLFDSTGDMVAFARAYKLKEEGKDVDHYDIFSTLGEYKWVNRGGWMLDNLLMDSTGAKLPNPIPNVVGKIMVVYYSQPEPEWADVQSMISRLETINSNHSDTNDYFGAPMLKIAGEIHGYAQKGETGKILQLEQGAEADYLALASEPASIKMEEDNLERYIYTMSQTPNSTFEQMKGIGPVSGIALKLLFLDAHMAAKNKEETFGIGLQRRINIIKAAIGMVINTTLSNEALSLQIKPVLTPYLPENLTEMLENLVLSTTNGFMSTETAIELNPLVPDSETEIQRIKDDVTSDVANAKGTEQVVI